MRDPNRIEESCNRLAEIWHQVPDWRLAQLMMNLISSYHQTHFTSIFHMEDEAFINYIEEYVKEIKNA